MKWTFADEPKYVATPQKEKPMAVRRGRKGKSRAVRSTATTTATTTSGSTSKSTSSSSRKRVKRDLIKDMEETTSNSSSGGGKRRRHSSPTDTEMTAKTAAVVLASDAATRGNNLFCQVCRRYEDETEIPVGLIGLPSHKTATFADVRRVIKQELDNIPVDWAWRFWVPGGTGTLSTRQEAKIKNMMTFFREACPGQSIGEGNLDSPVRIILVDAPPVLSWENSIV
jgi:hypothetical protein